MPRTGIRWGTVTGVLRSMDELDTEASVACESPVDEPINFGSDDDDALVDSVLRRDAVDGSTEFRMAIRLGRVARTSSRCPFNPSINLSWAMF